jgi:non-ribosomal peptide synthetase component F
VAKWKTLPDFGETLKTKTNETHSRICGSAMKKINKKNIEDILALTPMQEGMLFHYLKNPGSDIYFEQLSLEIAGKIDVEFFGKAWNFVIETNEMLRTIFRWEKAENPIQIILKEHKLRLEYYDFSDIEDNKKKRRLEEVKAEDRRKKFHLGEIPFRVTLCKLEKAEHVMIISNHHILYDGWSMGIILREFFQAYRQSSSGVIFSPPVKSAFKEFVKWMRAQDTVKAEKYWDEYLKGFGPGPDKAVSRERKKRKELKHTSNYQFKFPGELKRKLDVFIKGHRITAASFLYSVWGVLLQNYHAAADIIFDATVSGRSGSAPIKGIEDMVGLFIDTLPVRVRTFANETAADFLSRMSRMVREWAKFANSSPLQVREYLDKYREDNLFDSVVVMENYPLDRISPWETAPLSILSFSITEKTLYDLTIIITILEDIEFNITFNNDLFNENAISRLSSHLISLAEEIVSHPRKAVLEIGNWVKDERENFLASIGKGEETAADPDRERDYTAPRDEVEKKLVEVWSNILNIKEEEIGIDDNFFDFGGHSLKASLAVSRIRRVFEVKVPLEEIFQRSTIRELAGFIGNSAKQEYVPIPLAEEIEYYELSPGQRRLYMLRQLNPESTAYNGPWSMMLDGPIDEERIKQSFKGLIQRHEMLRTSFVRRNGEPVQKIHKQVKFEIVIFQKGFWPPEAIIKSFIRPFDLAKAPLLRVGLLREDTRKYILVVDMHHIVTDGMSTAVLTGEWARLYRGEDLPPLKIQYKDFSRWQNRRLMAGKLGKREEYWLKNLSGELPVLNLPLDFPRPLMQSFAGERISFEMADDLARQLRVLMKETGTTLFMALMSILNIVLGWYGDREDIVVGAPSAGRNHADVENTVGLFLETLAIRNRPETGKTFAKFLQEVKYTTLKAYENQDYPFSRLINQLSPLKNLSHNPLFDVMLNVLNQPGQAFELTGAAVISYEFDLNVSKVDMTLEVVEQNGEIRSELEYCTALFKKKTMERFVRHFLNTLRETVFNPGIRLGDIGIMDESEKRQILVEFNNTAVENDGARTLVDYFETRAARVPDRIAVVGPSVSVSVSVSVFVPITYRQITYRELDNRSNQIARRLREKGVVPDTIAGIMAAPSLEMITGIWGILKAGGAYLPIDPDYPEEQE